MAGSAHMAAWIDDADGWYSDTARELPADGGWTFIAARAPPAPQPSARQACGL
ncbi:hypothetical protein [Streptomyces cyaneochromogenes]|uniref:hypothetical protein n=1 Tax=Streptomyces cyaneochromogenes TaxID=2496836 RepID=UPI00158F411D|nr:hypothetical protein [Streptomyces cyaneochromogenes]